MAKQQIPKPWFKTARIALRRFVPSDAGDLLRLDSDPRVMRYINGGKPSTPAEIAVAMKRIPRIYAMYPGLGTWRAERRDTGAYIGWFTFKYVPKTPEIEVGYRLLHDAWGQGFATEGASAMRDYGFDDVGLSRIIGVTHRGNRASQHVLRKIGMADEGWGDYYDQRLRLFAVYAP